MLELDKAYMSTKFDDCMLSHSRDMVGVHQNVNMIMPLSGTVCHPWVSTCHDQPIYQIWSLFLHPPCRYEQQYIRWWGS